MRRVHLILLILVGFGISAYTGTLYINTYNETMAIKLATQTIWARIKVTEEMGWGTRKILGVYERPKTFVPNIPHVGESYIGLEGDMFLGRDSGQIVLGDLFDPVVEMVKKGLIDRVIFGYWPVQISQNNVLVFDKLPGESLASYLTLFEGTFWEFSPRKFDEFQKDHSPPFEYSLAPRPPEINVEISGGIEDIPFLVQLNVTDNGELEGWDLKVEGGKCERLSPFSFLIQPSATRVGLLAVATDTIGMTSTCTVDIILKPRLKFSVSTSSTIVEVGENLEIDRSSQIVGPGTSWPGTSIIHRVSMDDEGNISVEYVYMRAVDTLPPELRSRITVDDQSITIHATASDLLSTRVNVYMDWAKLALLNSRTRISRPNGEHLLYIEAIDGCGNATRWATILTFEPTPKIEVYRTNLGNLFINRSDGTFVINGRKIETGEFLLVLGNPSISITRDGEYTVVPP